MSQGNENENTFQGADIEQEMIVANNWYESLQNKEQNFNEFLQNNRP